MVNDVLGGHAVSLSYCTLCGSALLFDTSPREGETYTFGSSGLLYRSNKLMFDEQTNSLWSNLAGEPVWGPLVGHGKRLTPLPLVMTTWGDWRLRHPDTDVLALETGYQRDYRPGAAYGRYFASPEPMFPVWLKAASGPKPKDWVFALQVEGRRKAYPLKELMASGLIHDTVAGVGVVLLADARSGAVRAYRCDARRLAWSNGKLKDEENGLVFRLEEPALVAEDGSARLPRLPGHRVYWFAWYGFAPSAPLFGAP